MFNKGILSSVLALVLAAAAFGEVKILKLKDGRKFKGEITKTHDGYRVKTKIAVLTFAADQVAGIEDVVSPTTEYDDRVKKIDQTKPEDHFEVANWAQKAGLLEAARKHLKIALRLKPDYERAKLLLKIVEKRLDKIIKPPPKKNGDEKDVVFPRLKKEDIYRIRIEELREGDVVAVKFRNDVVKRFIVSMEGREEFEKPRAKKQFLALSGVRKALYMLDKRPDDAVMKDDILIQSDPRFMKEFRRLWPIVKNYCAASSCHGGAKPTGGLIFYTRGAGNERADYTNFVILDGIRARRRRLVDRNNPTESLLLHFLLPREQARYKHPRKISAAFKDRKAANYRRVLKWIRSLDGPIHPNYRLKYKPPFKMKLHTGSTLDLPPAGATQPTTAPARKDDFFD